MDRKIDFAILGAQKAGTTSLWHYLRQHPDLFFPEQKEISFFVRDEEYRKGESRLDVFYRDAPAEARLGIAYVHMLVHAKAAHRLRDHNPDMKVIALLRNPADRAYSAYWYARRQGRESSPTFEWALEKEGDRLEGSFRERAELCYRTHGHYAEQLEAYREAFPDRQIRVLLLDDLAEDPEGTLRDLFAWLDVERDVEIEPGDRRNTAALPRVPWLRDLLLSRDSAIKKLYHWLVSRRLWYWVNRRITDPLLRRNLKPFAYPPMDDETRARLVEHYRPHVRKLERMIGRDLGHWTDP